MSLGQIHFLLFVHVNRNSLAVIKDSNAWYPAAVLRSRVNNDVDTSTSLWMAEAIVRGVHQNLIKDLTRAGTNPYSLLTIRRGEPPPFDVVPLFCTSNDQSTVPERQKLLLAHCLAP